MRDQDTGQREVRGRVIDQNISILIDRVNVPIKLTNIYIETFLVHKILVSVQKIVKIKY